MHALAIKRSGKPVLVVGAPNALMFSADIATSVEDPEVTLDVRGMNDLGNERQSHTTWLELSPVSVGDQIEFQFIEAESFTPAEKEEATDSPEYVASRAEYEKKLEAEPLVPRPLEPRNPNACLSLVLPGRERIVAVLESGREFLTCRFVWSRWRPERCRVSLSSFSQQEALAHTGGRDWYSGVLGLGESYVVEVGA
jgi:hypothetical protein